MNFGWVEEGRLAGCRGPRSNRHLEYLRKKGIRALVRLAYENETGMSADDIIRHKLDDCYEPIHDFTAPAQPQIDRVTRFIHAAIHQGKPVAVSCGAGCGRTGTIIACYLVSLGDTADRAIDRLISIRPVSREILDVPGQREAVLEFARRKTGDRWDDSHHC